MASRKKKRSSARSSHGSPKKPSKVSTQTRTKLSQHAKGRARMKGRFLSEGALAARKQHFYALDEDYMGRLQDAEARFAKEAPGASPKLKRDFARTQTELYDRGGNLHRRLTKEEMEMAPVRVTSTDSREGLMTRRRAGWETEAGLYQHAGAMGANKRYISPSSFVTKELPENHRAVIEGMMNDPSSAFNRGLPPQAAGSRTRWSAGARHRLEIYTRKLQEGATHEEALQALEGERRGRKPSTARTFSQEGVTVEPGVKREAGRRSKWESSVPKEADFSIGIDMVRPDTIEELRKKLPGKSERQLVEISQRQKEYLYDNEILKNQRWAHETRTANILGKRASTEDKGIGISPSRGPSKVTVFTTNFGHPNVTVPTDSLVGQYIIRGRKKMLLEQKVASKSQLKGRFPEAVRDQHIVEAVTARHIGAEGRAGVYKRGGWRRGNKRSTGFGKSTPVGSQIIYDSAGRPMYDEHGNIRFSQGATRPFRIGTEHEKGLGIYIG